MFVFYVSSSTLKGDTWFGQTSRTLTIHQVLLLVAPAQLSAGPVRDEYSATPVHFPSTFPEKLIGSSMYLRASPPLEQNLTYHQQAVCTLIQGVMVGFLSIKATGCFPAHFGSWEIICNFVSLVCFTLYNHIHSTHHIAPPDFKVKMFI